MQDEGSEDMTLLISANEMVQIAFKVPSVIAASLKFAGVGFIAIFVVVNNDAMVDCVGFYGMASVVLCHFPGQY